jgi:hypothetical protein
MIHHLLLDERFDEAIFESLMYENFKGQIVDSGNVGNERIYLTLAQLEEFHEIKL